MKKTLFLCLSLFTSYTVRAQLVVNESGKVGIKTTGSILSTLSINSNGATDFELYTSGSQKGIHSNINNSSGASWGTAIEGFAIDNSSSYRVGVHGAAYNNSSVSGRTYGVLGRAGGGSSNRNFSIFGQLMRTANGAAIYGTTTETDFGVSIDKRYAGYFVGPVKVSGNLEVSGTINGVVLSSGSKNSTKDDFCSKDVIGEIPQRLKSLNMKKYLLSPLSISESENQEETDTIESSTASKDRNSIAQQCLSKQHYGFNADELEEVFPDLVYDNEDGTKSINYVEMVPILVQAINELNEKIEALENGNTSAKKIETQAATNIDEIGDNVTLLALGQNKPNPFGTSTSIEVSIPDDVKSAFIYVYDLTGKKLQQIDITARGKQTVTINASALTDGMYLYSLIADGKVAETRRMIVEK